MYVICKSDAYLSLKPCIVRVAFAVINPKLCIKLNACVYVCVCVYALLHVRLRFVMTYVNLIHGINKSKELES